MMTQIKENVQRHREDIMKVILNFCNPYILQMSAELLCYIWDSLWLSINTQKRIELWLTTIIEVGTGEAPVSQDDQQKRQAQQPRLHASRSTPARLTVRAHENPVKMKRKICSVSSRSFFTLEGISPSAHHWVLGCEWGFHRDRSAYIDAGGVAMRPHEDM